MKLRIYVFLCVLLSALFLFACAEEPEINAEADKPCEISGLSLQKTENTFIFKAELSGSRAGNFEYKARYPDQSYSGESDGEFVLPIIENGCAAEIILTPYSADDKGRVYADSVSFVFDHERERKEDEIPEIDGALEIDEPAELILFAKRVNNGENRLSAMLTADIDMGECFEWSGIGNSDNMYDGVFNANGKSVSGLYILCAEKKSLGFFSSVGDEGVITGLSLKNCRVFANSNRYVGSIVGELYGRAQEVFSDAYISNLSLSGVEGIYERPSEGAIVGGICGKIDGICDPGILNAKYNGKIELDAKYVISCAGVCGNAAGGFFLIRDSEFGGEINFKSGYYSEKKSSVSIGGVVGGALSGEIYGCTNNGKITDRSSVESSVGGICGSVKGSAVVADCMYGASAEIFYDGLYKASVGGIIGSVSVDSMCGATLARCASLGRLLSYRGSIGGLVGYLDELFFISDCYSRACMNITSSDGDSVVGGAVGYVKDTENGSAVIFRTATEPCFEGNADYNGIFGLCEKGCETLTKELYFVSDGSNISSDAAIYGKSVDKSELADIFGKLECFLIDGTDLRLAWELDRSLVGAPISNDIYTALAIDTPDVEDGFYAKKYVLNIADGENRITPDMVFERVGETGKSTHWRLSNGGKEKEKCSCALFEKDHYLSADDWYETLVFIDENLQSIADHTNYGKIKYIEMLTVDAELSGKTTNAYCTRTNDNEAGCKVIAYNPDLFEKSVSDRNRTICHELVHAMSMDVGISSFMTEGYADFITYLIIGDERIDSYVFNKDDKRGEYTPTAAFYAFVYKELGRRGLLLIREIGERGSGDCNLSYGDAFGATFEMLWDEWFGKSVKK